MKEQLIKPTSKPRGSFLKALCCCFKPEPAFGMSSSDMSVTQSIASQIAKLELPINEYAMGRTYLIGKGSSRLAVQFNHISFDRPPRAFSKASKPINVPSKAWAKRYELFSLFDQGIEITKDSWDIGIPEVFAEHMGSRFTHCKIIDAYCGSGSLTVQLARSNQVAALDTSTDRIASARHNVGVYQVAHSVRFYQGELIEFSNKLTADAVFLTPPWTFSEYFDLIQLSSPLEELLEAASKAAPSAVLYLPVNYDPVALCEAVHSHSDFDQVVEFEVFFYKNKPVALVCYLGACVRLSHSDLSSIVASKLGCRADLRLTELVEGSSVRKLIDSLTRTEHELTGRGQQNVEVLIKNHSKFHAPKADDLVRLWARTDCLDSELIRLALRNCRLGNFIEEPASRTQELKVLITGQELIGAHSIVRFLYQRAKMYPVNLYKAYLADSVIDLVRDITAEVKASPSVAEYLNSGGRQRLELLDSRMGKGYGEVHKTLGDLYVECLVRFCLKNVPALPANLSRYYSSSIFSF
jgi:2-polyprenyl-3-methyl-5-hydroxy-6-metoxy-1,4-benzoquinol methylase